MDFADILIWGGLTVIVLRYLTPRIIEWLGFEITKAPKSDTPKSDTPKSPTQESKKGRGE